MHTTPGFFRVECCHPEGCAAVVCGVGEPHKAIRAVGWMTAYGMPLCPMHRPDGIVAAAAEAANFQAAIGMARVAQGLARAFFPEEQEYRPTLTGAVRDPWSTGTVLQIGPSPGRAVEVLDVAQVGPRGDTPPSPFDD